MADVANDENWINLWFIAFFVMFQIIKTIQMCPDFMLLEYIFYSSIFNRLKTESYTSQICLVLGFIITIST